MPACCKGGFKAVPINDNRLSSDLFTPDSPVRVTQNNIAQYFVPEIQDDKETCECPGMPLLKSRDRPPYLGDAPPCPQHHGQYDAFIPAPEKEAHLIHKMQRQNLAIPSPLPAKKQFFPRSKDFELESDVIHCKKDKEFPLESTNQKAFCCHPPQNVSGLECDPNFRSNTLNPYFYNPIVIWHPQPQFWYLSKVKPPGSTWPVGSPDDYRFDSLPYPNEGITLLEKLEIERPERYLPGEIYKNSPVKEAIEDLSKKAKCSKVWKPKDPTFCDEFIPGEAVMNRPRLLDEVLSRKRLNHENILNALRENTTNTCNYKQIPGPRVKGEKLSSGLSNRIKPTGVDNCQEICAFKQESRPHKNACDLTKPKLRLPLGVMKKIYPQIGDEVGEGEEGFSKMEVQDDEVTRGNFASKEPLTINKDYENNLQPERMKCCCQANQQRKNECPKVLQPTDHRCSEGRPEGPQETRRPKICSPIEPGLPTYDSFQFSKVGQTFKSDAIKQHRCLHPPPQFKPVFEKGKRQFPDFGLSHI